MSTYYMVPGLTVTSILFGTIGILGLLITIYYNGITLAAIPGALTAGIALGISLFMGTWAYLIMSNPRFAWFGEL